MSLRRTFILVFSALLTALAALAAAFSYYSTRNEAWSILGFQLQQIAGVVGDGSGLVHQRMVAGASDEIVAVRIMPRNGPPVTNDVSLHFPETPSSGFSTFSNGSVEWRLLTDIDILLTTGINGLTGSDWYFDTFMTSVTYFGVPCIVLWVVLQWWVNENRRCRRGSQAVRTLGMRSDPVQEEVRQCQCHLAGGARKPVFGPSSEQ